MDGGSQILGHKFLVHKILGSQNLHKIISTHLLTVLIMRAIVQIEQRKGNKKKVRQRVFRTYYECLKGDRTYVNA